MFEILKQKVRAQFDAMVAAAPLYAVKYDRDAIWQTYYEAFPEGEERQSHNCSCCRAFIRQAGNAVTILPDGQLETIWDVIDIPEEYVAAIEALGRYVRTQPVDGLWFHENPSVGVDKNRDPVRNVIWQHFHAPVPREYHDKNDKLTRKSANLRDVKDSFSRGLKEITVEACEVVMELVGQNLLYRGPESLHLVEGFHQVLVKHRQNPIAPNNLWRIAGSIPEPIAKIRTTSIGTLLLDLSAGEKSLEDAVAAYENKVSSGNYRRTTALVTPRMTEDAKKELEALGYISALSRRVLSATDITAANALFVYRPTAKAGADVFDAIAAEAVVDPRKLSTVDTVSLDDFLEKVLPTAKELRVLFEGRHLSNLVTLTGPGDPDAPSIFSWDNAFAWSYSGGLDDSIKERVKAAGGNVSGWLRASLSWSNFDDLDLHFTGNGINVYYGAKRDHRTGVNLDVDMNAGTGTTRTPVENIVAPSKLPSGRYEVKVRNYSRRETQFTGYTVEIEVNGDIQTFSKDTNPSNQSFGEAIVIDVKSDGQVSISGKTFSSSASGVNKWGLTTGAWQTVKVATLSPNHWTKPTGPKHLFLMLKGCTTDEPTKPFLNAHLNQVLTKHRKVMEVLSNKVVVADAVGEEMSGLGFSSSKTDHFFVEVTSTFKRVIKVMI